MKKKLKNVLAMARPKGKKYFTCSFALNQEQINFIQQQPNASETLRKLIDSLILMQSDMKPELETLYLKTQLEHIEREYRKLQRERAFYESDHATDIYEQKGYPTDKKPKATPEAEYHLKILHAYDNTMEKLENKHEELKKKIMETEFK
jgi:hypothetical protein